jgi:hypothetical protein
MNDEIELLLPLLDADEPEVTVLIPAMNESLTVEETVAWCLEGFARADIVGEVLIVDSSDDGTERLAVEAGARVLRVPRRGLGRAYLDAIPYVRGRFVILGDADCTYDFRELEAFVAKLREGYEFVMGTRFRGSIEPGAMPLHHRYLGSPSTTFIFNRVFSTKFSDIHCGMRGLTLDAYKRLDLRAQGWEYASEMIIGAVKLHLRTTEVPINFLKDRNGRVSNVKRGGWTTSWKAGWRSLQVMFVHGPDFFLLRPGAVAFAIGGAIAVALSAGPIDIGGTEFTLHTLAIAMAITIAGAFSFALGLMARAITDPSIDTTNRLAARLPFDRTSVISSIVAFVGTIAVAQFVVRYVGDDRKVTGRLEGSGHFALFGVLLVTLSCVLFTTMLVAQALHQLRSRTAVDGATSSSGGKVARVDA